MDSITSVYQDYLRAIQKGAFAQASQTVQTALQKGMTPTNIYDNVFTPALREVGKMWETGKMTVAQEHLATGITEYCRTLIANSPSQTALPSAPAKVLLTNAGNNQHTLGVNLLCDVFRWHGWQVYPLITPLPEEQIAQAAKLYGVDLVCLSVALPGQIARAVNAIKILRESQYKGLIEIGGAAFQNNESAANITGADFLGLSAESTVKKATELLHVRRAGKP